MAKDIKKSEVYSADDLKMYLSQKATQNNRLYHYTTYEALLSILSNKSFRLSRLDLMNDKAETSLGFHDDSFKNYSMSFTQGKEYVSMWAMYGKSSGIKLRLDFDNKVFSKMPKELFMDSQKKNKISIANSPSLWDQSYNSYPIQLSDVVYLDKKDKSLRHNARPFESGIIGDDNTIEEMTGFIKYDAWEFEKETRLKVKLSEDRLSVDMLPKHIFVVISDELIKTFHITFNPWMSPLMKNEIKESLKRVAGYAISFDDSDDDGEISEL